MTLFIQKLTSLFPASTQTGPEWRRWLAPAEFAFLLLFAFFLPFREAPKTIFGVLYLVTWLVNRTQKRNFGGPWNPWDLVALTLPASGLLAAAFAGIRSPGGREWLALNDPFMQTTLLLCLSRGRYEVAQWKALFGMLLFSCLLSEIEGLWLWKITGSNAALQLKSVGHVNHSAIYLAITTGLAFTSTLCSIKKGSLGTRIGLSVTSLSLFLGVLMSDSRAAVGTGVALVCILSLVACRWLPRPKIWITVILSTITVGIIFFGQGTIKKQRENVRNNNQLAYRDKIWNRGLVAWKANPFFGVGTGNFIEISDARLTQWLREDGKLFDSETYFRPISHAHSLFINTLAEKGATGAVALLIFFGFWGLSLVAALLKQGADPESFLFWGGSFSAWLISIAAGLANTTLHHEHALLSIILFAAWLSWRHAHANRVAL